MTKSSKILLSIFIILLCSLGGAHLFNAIKLKIDLYNNLVSSVENKNWDNAKSSLDQLGNYRNSLSYTDEVNFQYYLTNGDKEYSNKNYDKALNFYNNAHNYKKEDKNLHKNLQIKINKTENQIKIKEAEDRKKAAIAKAKALKKQEAIKRQNQQELAELERLVRQSFVSINIQNFDDSETGGYYEFFIYPEAWFNLSYNEKKNVMVSCRKYIQLKEGVSERKAEVGVRIKSTYDGKELGNALSVK